MKNRRIIKELYKANPYPKEVFLPRTKKEMKKASRLLMKNGLSPDGIFGSFGRKVWNSAVAKLEEVLDEKNEKNYYMKTKKSCVPTVRELVK